MKYRILSVLVFSFFLVQKNFAQTNVGGEIAGNTTWDLTGSPYIIVADVTVDTGITLTIDSGVVIKFDAGKSLGINGTIRAIGTASNPITFDADTIGNPTDFYWAGIYITNSSEPFDFSTQSGCLFKYCNFYYSGTPNFYVDPSGNTTLTVSSLVSLGFENCYVENCACGLTATASSQVSGNIFKDCTADYYSGYLIKVGQNSAIYNNIIYRTGVANSAGIITASKNTQIYNNVFADNSFVYFQLTDNGINFLDSCRFFGNTMVDNTEETGIIFFRVTSGYIYKNTFTRNKGGAQTFTLSNCYPVFHNNNVLNNQTAIQGVDVEMAASAGGQEALAENNFWGYTDSASIASVIFDKGDNGSLCRVDYVPFHLTPDTSAPVLPPIGVKKKDLFNDSLRITWNKNAEADLKGYRVYFNGYNGYSFTNFVNAGIDTSIVIGNVSVNDPIAVTAYDSLANGINDQVEGHESWFTLAVTDTTVGISNPIVKKQQTITVQPNPSNGNFLVQLLGNSSQVLLDVFDMEGRQIIENVSAGNSSVSLHLEKPGVYFLKAISSSSVLGYAKIIVVQ